MPEARRPPSPAIPRIRRVAVLVDTATGWGRGIISGIHRYASAAGNWQIFVEAAGIEESSNLPADWSGDGIIARVATARTARILQATGLPVINVSGVQITGPVFPRVSNDAEEVARIAVDYFLQRGFRQFAYLSLRGLEFVARQRDAYVRHAAEAGFPCATRGLKVHAGFQSPDWNLKIDKLARWLVSLPKPVALLAWSGGREVIHACQRAGLRVPEEVAVLCGSDDDLLCQISPIPISGVQGDYERIGHAAAEALDAAMRGEPLSPSPVLIPPIGVITRRSTDTMAMDDPAMVAALGFIKQHTHQPISVEDVARAAGISRRVLERRFQESLNTTPARHVIRVRLDRVRQMLRETSLSVAEISEATGFLSPEYMTSVFRQYFQSTPLRYRKEFLE